MNRFLKSSLNALSIIALTLSVIFAISHLVIPEKALATWDGTVATAFASGRGTEENPYKIKTEAQLGYFLENIKAGVTYEGKYIELYSDLDMTGDKRLSCGGTFSGSFDGNGHVIRTPFALFNALGSTGTIKRLICIATETLVQSPLVETNYGLIESCLVNGSADDDEGDDVVGLVCDYNGSTGIIRNCGGVGSVYATGDDNSVDVGLIGENQGGVIEHCYSALTVSGFAPGKYNDVNRDAICGTNSYSATITDCYYNSDLYTYSTSQATAMTTSEMKSASFVDTMNGSLYTGCFWVMDTENINGGYPIPTACYEAISYLTQSSEKVYIYHTDYFTAKLISTGSGTIYYTLDGTDPTTSSTRKTYSKPFTISGDAVVRSVVYYNGQYGAVSTQQVISLIGSGTENSPYKIYTKKQLDAVRYDLDACYKLMNDLTFTDEDFALSGVVPGGWDPIGATYDTMFSGTFDGNACAIYNMQGIKGGLFGFNGGTIKNLRMIGHRNNAVSTTTGGIANYNYGLITRCYVKSGYTEDEIFPASTTAGGIVGSDNGTVSYCRNDGVVGMSMDYKYATHYIGGIVGQNGTVEFCVNTGTVVMSSPYALVEYAYGAGINGGGRCYNCRNEGKIRMRICVDYPSVGMAPLSTNWAGQGYASCCYVGETEMVHEYSSGSAKLSAGVYTNGRYYNCYNTLSYLEADYPELDFENNWMITSTGPMPQGVMDEDGHCWVKSSYTAPACTEPGSLVCYDLLSPSTYKTEELPALGHKFSSWTALNDTEYHIRSCVREGCSEIESEKHVWETTDVVAPTCLADGTIKYTCSGCSSTKTETGEAKVSCSFETYTLNEDATCLADGTESASCIYQCGETHTRTVEGSKLAHSFTSYTSDNNATCQRNATETACCDYGCTTTDTREVADSTVDHAYGEWEVLVSPDYISPGIQVRKCKYEGCSQQEEQLIDPTGPSLIEQVETKYDPDSGTLRLDNIPSSLTVIFAAYNDDGRLIDVEIRENVGSNYTLTILADLAPDTIRIFFVTVNAWVAIASPITVPL